jgi:hypothetical protein
MNLKAILFAAAILIVGTASAENVGLSYLGICNRTWPCEASLKAYDKLPVIRTGWLEQSFGVACPCADKLLRDKRPKEVRIHLANGPCMRNRRCGRGEVFHGFTIAKANRDLKRADSTIAQRVERIAQRVKERLEQSRGALTCYVSPVLEGDINEDSRKALHRIAGAYLPNCTLVDSPHRRPCLPNTVCEAHGENPTLKRPCIADLDGVSAYDTHLPTYLRQTAKCDLSYLWAHGFNCNKQGASFSGPPSARNCAGATQDIEKLVKWLRATYR